MLRIDTGITSAIGTAAYSAQPTAGNVIIAATAGTVPAGGFLRPVGGRKIEDDVIDITLKVLQNGTTVGADLTDNVSYGGTAGNEANPGHKLLNGQAAANQTATFPFLAAPN